MALARIPQEACNSKLDKPKTHMEDLQLIAAYLTQKEQMMKVYGILCPFTWCYKITTKFIRPHLVRQLWATRQYADHRQKYW